MLAIIQPLIERIISIQIPWVETCILLVLALITVYRKQLSANDEYRTSNKSRRKSSSSPLDINTITSSENTDIIPDRDFENYEQGETLEEPSFSRSASLRTTGRTETSTSLVSEDDVSEYEIMEQPSHTYVTATVDLLWRRMSEKNETLVRKLVDNDSSVLQGFEESSGIAYGAKLSSLSEEMLFQIAHYLDTASIISLSLCNSHLRHTLTCNVLWKHLFTLTFGKLLLHPFVLELLRDRGLEKHFESPTAFARTCDQMLKRAGSWLRLCVVWETQWQDWLCAGLCTTEKSLLAFDDRIFDVTTFLPHHPGSSETLAEHCGAEVSDIYAEIGHSTEAHALRERYVCFDASVVCERSPGRSVSAALRDEFRQRQYALTEEAKLPLFALPRRHLLPQLYLQYRHQYGSSQHQANLITKYEVQMGRDGHTLVDIADPVAHILKQHQYPQTRNTGDSNSEESHITFEHVDSFGYKAGKKLIRRLQYYDESSCGGKPPVISTSFAMLNNISLYDSNQPNSIINTRTTDSEETDEQAEVAPQPSSGVRAAGGFIANKLLQFSKAIDLDLQPLLLVVAAASQQLDDLDDDDVAAPTQEQAKTQQLQQQEVWRVRNVLPAVRSDLLHTLSAVTASVSGAVTASVSGAVSAILTTNRGVSAVGGAMNDENGPSHASHNHLNHHLNGDSTLLGGVVLDASDAMRTSQPSTASAAASTAVGNTSSPSDIDAPDESLATGATAAAAAATADTVIAAPDQLRLGEEVSGARCVWRGEHNGNARVFFDPLQWQWALWFSCCGRVFHVPCLCQSLVASPRRNTEVAAAPVATHITNHSHSNSSSTISNSDNTNTAVAPMAEETQTLSSAAPDMTEGNAISATSDARTSTAEGGEVTEPAEVTSLPNLTRSLPSLTQSLSRRVTDAISLSRSASLTLASGLTQQLGGILQYPSASHSLNSAFYNIHSAHNNNNNNNHNHRGEDRRARLYKRLQREPYLAAITLPELPKAPTPSTLTSTTVL